MTVWDNTTGSSYTYIPSGTTVTGTAITTPGTFTGTISGSVLTASSVTGTLAVGQQINGAGVTPGSFISSFGTGSGGAGTYNLNQSDAAIGTPEAMTATIETVTISNNLTTTLQTIMRLDLPTAAPGIMRRPLSQCREGAEPILTPT